MRKQLGFIMSACLYFSGLVKLARWRTQRSNRGLIILNYHRASGGDLRRHLRYLRRHYRLLHLEAALDELYAAPQTGKAGPAGRDRRLPLVLTFDDGYHDNYTHAVPLARELQVPITIFLIPGYIQSGERFWWLESKRLASRTQVSEVTIEGRTYHLGQAEERQSLAQAIDARLRYATSVKEREDFLAAARQELAVPDSVMLEEETAQPLTWAEVQKMQESGWASFGAHTMHHPILSYLADPHEVQREVEECRALLEQRLGHPVRVFAYPVGQAQHLRGDVIQALQQAGYDWALTTIYGINGPKSDPYLLHRIEVDTTQHWLVMAAEAAGLWGFFSRLRWVPFVRKYLRNHPGRSI